MEVKGDKELEYAQKLLYQSPNPGKINQAVNTVLRRSRTATKTKSEWAQFLSDKKDPKKAKRDSYAHDYLKKLKRLEILEQEGEKLTGSKPVPKWKINRTKLKSEITKSEWYSTKNNFLADLVDHAGDF